MKAKLIFYLMLAFALLHGQEVLPPPPPGPLIQTRAADMTKWTITSGVASSDSSGVPAPSPEAPKKIFSQVTLTKSGNVMLRATVDDGGAVWNTWCLQQQQYLVWPDGKTCIVAQPGPPDQPNPNYVDFSSSDFPSFYWISLKNYAGIKTYGSQSCLVFKDVIKFFGGYSATPVTAYIDVKTRLPVAFENNGIGESYQFEKVKDSLELPDLVKQKIKLQKLEASSISRRIPQ